jgi:SAM-dependent methyltransferase
VKNPAVLEGLLVCPTTHEPLRFAGNAVVTAGGRSYPVIDGVPILRPGPVKTKDPRHESHTVSADFQRYMRSVDGPVLFLGAGSTSFRADNVIELEYELFRNTDIVADAHHLPVADDAVGAVMAFNVFEHLYEPAMAAAEIHRVLRPGGRVVIHTAFLQPLHEEPAHYYNATEFGVRRWFGSFSDVEVKVSGNFNPYFALSWFASELLMRVRKEMGAADSEFLGRTTLAELAMAWQTGRHASPELFDVFRRLPDNLQRRLAAGFEVSARKADA